MALYAFDGTGDEDTDRVGRDSNVLDFFRAYDGGPKNEDPSLRIGSLYLKGIGKRARSFVGDGPAQAFGVGRAGCDGVEAERPEVRSHHRRVRFAERGRHELALVVRCDREVRQRFEHPQP